MTDWTALYLATDHATAVAEYHQGLPKSGTLVPYRLQANAIVDLTDGHGGAADERVARATAGDWKTVACLDGAVPDSWALAQELIAAEAEGALAPSIQNRGGSTLVLWRWHNGAATGEGAAVTLLDPDRTLVADASSV